jgi:PPK2 family polyphosphate:nucleotide phosphotransferase
MGKLDTNCYYVTPGKKFDLSTIDPGDTQGLNDDEAIKELVKENRKRIGRMQKQLLAAEQNAVLLMIQAMDAGGKDSTIRRTLTGLNPHGIQVTSFKSPTSEELRHDFLWRIHAAAPEKGMIAVHNRSHYEDVLIASVDHLAPKPLIKKRFRHINDFEQMLHDHGTHILKVFLHISQDHQLGRFRNRLENPEKRWKFEPADLQARGSWDAYMKAYEDVFYQCSADHAPWYVVPANNKWFRSLVVGELLAQTLEKIDPQYPEPKFDPADYPLKDLK